MQHDASGNLLKNAAGSELADTELATAAADLEAQGYDAAAELLRSHARACRVDAMQMRAPAGGQTYMELARQPVRRKS